MNTGQVAKNVLIIALGGSGRKTAVMLREKISRASEENGVGNQVNLKIVSIDFPAVQCDGYLVQPNEYLPILLPQLRFNDCWTALQKDLESMPEEEVEPWMNVGPLSEMELWLAQDAQQSGIRRVDYFLLVHHVRQRIKQAIHSALVDFPKTDDPYSQTSVMILGSLAGRTGSISYVPVLKILESLTAEFKLASNFSFLYMPQAFEMRLNVESELNFFSSLSRIRKYFGKESANSLSLTQFLVDEPNQMLTSYRDSERVLPYSKIIESIERLLGLVGAEDSSGGYYNEWFRSIKRVDIAEIESMAERNKQINRYQSDSPFAIPQNWNSDSLERVFANLEKNT
jgi:hypothetical protein